MAGIYIHIPFCKKACHYCNFHFSTSMKYKSEMIEAICLELSSRADEFSREEVNTIYFGGGTPSLMSQKEVSLLLSTIYDHYQISQSLEVTIEANPDDLDYSILEELKRSGINRLSIGIQSFSDDLLYQMNRVHTGDESEQSVQKAKQIGFENISIDLIFGLPELTNNLWQETLSQAIDLEVQHLSCYNLTLEENTALWHFVNNNKMTLPKENDQESQFFYAHDFLASQGYNHYEISNYSLLGAQSKHNSNYWNRTAYMGVGPSAHSYQSNRRRWNINNNSKYMKAILGDFDYFDEEILSKQNQFNEIIMLGLRTATGVSKSILNHYDYSKTTEFLKTINEYINHKIIIETGTHYKLTNQSFYLSDNISSNLFMNNHE
ncbi:MAG: radical SAM family heme chaperone HemW [Saprospiraceae bacterium]